MASRKYFLIFLLVRLSSVFLVQTWFVPDEYWQSLEVAHNLIFKYGFLSWEWQEGLRSYIYPSMIAVLFKVLEILRLDYPFLLVFLPRICQSLLTCIADCYVLLLMNKFGCAPFWSSFTIVTNWFVYYCGSRTLINTFESSLTSIALYYYPWYLVSSKLHSYNETEKNEISKSMLADAWKYLTLAGINCVIRPTAATVWAPLIAYHLFTYRPFFKKLFFCRMLPIALIILSVSILIDYWCYGHVVLSPFNFLKFNFLNDISYFYGTHPFHWYLFQGIPVLLGVHTMPFILRTITLLFLDNKRKGGKKDHGLTGTEIEKFFLLVIGINVIVYSSVPHKEFRFLLPLVPMMMIISVKYFSEKKIKRWWKHLWISSYILGFIVPTVVFGMFHQKGVLTVMGYLSHTAAMTSNSSYLFLMPCHSTPLYSHIHVNVTTRFLTCDPPLQPHSFDESNYFYKNPLAWLNTFWNETNELNLPTHIICFDVLFAEIEKFVTDKGYQLDASFYHTFFAESRVGRNVVVLKKS